MALQRVQYPGEVSYDVHAVGFGTGLTAVLLALRGRLGLRHWTPATPVSTRSGAPPTS